MHDIIIISPERSILIKVFTMALIRNNSQFAGRIVVRKLNTRHDDEREGGCAGELQDSDGVQPQIEAI